ncbi:ankyrin repeat domain-containing protein [Litoribrevibacter albus]|uniref:Ankyrin repeat domain-containing protein n=1 Tax=Litoribrevibacter albus TaxID=1473156 RepID=A0AA37SDW1_9GAMM|nr:ankyrin repeat domain-containing protein [Litoribrevibacter albus]GLQ32703.1 hypothetical protein GCM10007876_31820 [Litoribrevibacter albus]
MDSNLQKYFHVLIYGTPKDLDLLADEDSNFPHGVDSVVERHWIINAVDVGTLENIDWMIKRKVPLNFTDEEGGTVLHSAMERNSDEKYAIMKLLLTAGANPNIKGLHDYTPAHKAAVSDDI